MNDETSVPEFGCGCLTVVLVLIALPIAIAVFNDVGHGMIDWIALHSPVIWR